MSVEFLLPELGENVEKGDVVRVMVAVGDTVKLEQPVLELETDKATIEVPSGVAGTVTEVRVKAGDKVKVGQSVIVVEGGEAKGDAPAPPASKPETSAPVPAETRAPEERKAPSRPASVVPISAGRPPSTAPVTVEGQLAPAAPSVRRFAREFGVEIGTVSGTGPGGRIGQGDVKDHVKTLLSTSREPVISRTPLPDFSRWGEVDVVPMTNIRRKTAEHLTATWQAPHVTQHDLADMTTLEEFRKEYGPRVEANGGGKLTVTVILVKLIAEVLDHYPQFASSIDMVNQVIVVKKYRHIGIAVDTPNGLLVPVIRDVNKKTLTEIAKDVGVLSAKAKDKKLSLEEMAGGVFTISNLGGIGGTAFTPLINPPEVAILGVSRGSVMPRWRDGQFVPRQMLPLSLSYDHRAVDGADAARFLRAVAEALEQPLALHL